MTSLDDFLKALKEEGFWSDFVIMRRPGGWIAFIEPGTIGEPEGWDDVPGLGLDQAANPCQYEACRSYLSKIRGKTIRINHCGMWQGGSRRVPIPEDLQVDLQL